MDESGQLHVSAAFPRGRILVPTELADGWAVEPKSLLISLETPAYKNERTIINRELLAHWGYSNISNCRTKFLPLFRGIIIIFFLLYFKIVTYLFHYFSRNPQTVFFGTLRFRGTLFEKHWPVLCDRTVENTCVSGSSKLCVPTRITQHLAAQCPVPFVCYPSGRPSFTVKLKYFTYSHICYLTAILRSKCQWRTPFNIQ